MNVVNLIGRLAVQPTLSKTDNGISVCRFRLAVKRKYKVNNETVTDFLNIVAWREQAEFVGRYLSKGQQIGVTGSVQPKECKTKSGEKYIGFEIIADFVELAGPSPAIKDKPSEQAEASEQDAFPISLDDEDLPF